MFRAYKIDLNVDFPDFCAKHIKKHIPQYDKIFFITANRRLLLYVKNELDIDSQLKIESFTMDDFVKYLTLNFSTENLKVHSKLERELFILDLLKNKCFNLYKKFGDDDTKVFLWAKKISALFDEIDKHLIKENLINFQYVEAVEPAKEFLENLKSLYEIYENEYEDFCYNGKFYQIASKINSKNISQEFGNTLFIFSGMLFFTKSEQIILNNISQYFDLHFLVHTDLFDRDKIKINEKVYDFEIFNIVDNALEELTNDIKKQKEKLLLPEIQLHEFSNTHYETGFIAKTVKENLPNFENQNDPKNIGVILPNSSALFPLLNNLDDKLPLNITMGYPFSKTAFGLFLHDLFELLSDIDIKKEYTKTYCCDTKLLIQFLNSKIFSLFKNKQDYFEMKKKLLQSKSLIYTFQKNDPIFQNILAIFLEGTTFEKFYNSFISFYKNFDLKTFSYESNKFTAQMIQLFYREFVDSLKTFGKREISVQFMYHLIREAINDFNIPFEGHPLKGVQILGVLEARLIPFEKLIIADVNEGVWPQSQKVDPLIPENIKSSIGLTGYKDRERLMKYYFFRSIFSSKSVEICYINAQAGNDKLTKSRFIEQLILMQELKNKEIVLKKYYVNLPKIESHDAIKKDENTIEFFQNHIENDFISPTELDEYLTCPYKYYLSRIKKIPKPIKFDTDFEADSVGILIHDLLEKGFKHHKEKIIDKNLYKQIGQDILKMANEIDINYIAENDNSTEKIQNYLKKLNSFQFESLKTIIEYRLKSFFNELKNFKEFKLIDTEYKATSEQFKLLGIFDRIDLVQESNTIRIIDYKTSSYPKYPKVKNLEKMIDKFEFDDDYSKEKLEILKNNLKTSQFYVYMLIAKELFPENTIDVTVYALGGNVKEKTLTEENIKFYEKIISYIKNHMEHCQYIFALPSDSCNYCDYKNFCKFI